MAHLMEDKISLETNNTIATIHQGVGWSIIVSLTNCKKITMYAAIYISFDLPKHRGSVCVLINALFKRTFY